MQPPLTADTQALVSTATQEASSNLSTLAASAEPWQYEQTSLQRLLSETASTVATMADWRQVPSADQADLLSLLLQPDWCFAQVLADLLPNKQKAGICACRPFAFGSEVWAAHWVKFGWEGNRPNGHACWGTGWGDPHSCEYSMLSRLDTARQELVPVHVFRQPLVGSAVKCAPASQGAVQPRL